MFMRTSFLFFFYSCFMVVMLFSFSLSLSLSLSLTNKLRMAPKVRKSTPGQNPLQGSDSSSSDPIPPPHVRYHDEKARKDFLETFQKRGVHPERHVILSDLSDTTFPTFVWTMGWESLLESPLRCPIMFIHVFYSNIHCIDTSIPQFATTFRGTRIVVTWILYLRFYIFHRYCILTTPTVIIFRLCLETSFCLSFMRCLPYRVESKTPHARAL